MMDPHPTGTLEFRVNRIPRTDPGHTLRAAHQLEALRALVALVDRGVN